MLEKWCFHCMLLLFSQIVSIRLFFFFVSLLLLSLVLSPSPNAFNFSFFRTWFDTMHIKYVGKVTWLTVWNINQQRKKNHNSSDLMRVQSVHKYCGQGDFCLSPQILNYLIYIVDMQSFFDLTNVFLTINEASFHCE